MIVAIGCDHAGFVLKSTVRNFFCEKEIEIKKEVKEVKKEKFEIMDFGIFEQERADYPDIALQVAKAVSEHKADIGVLLCGTGIGMAIAANKVKNIRAAACNDIESARLSKAHNNLNILCLGGRLISPEQAISIMQAWFETDFEGGRHSERINKIAQIELNKI